MLSQWGGNLPRLEQLICPPLCLGGFVQTMGALSSFFFQKDKEKNLPRRPIIIYINPEQRVEPLRLEVS